MKNGNYEGWSEQENKLRSMLISQVLQHNFFEDLSHWYKEK